jgi:hypothetical protein
MLRPFTACTLVCLLAFSESLNAQQTPASAAPTQPAKAPIAEAAAPEPPRVSLPNTLMDGTAVKLSLVDTISSADARVGQQVSFEVTEDVVVDGVTVIVKGSPALASVTEAQAKRRMGRAGKLSISVDSVRLTGGEKVPLRAVKDTKGSSHVGRMTTAMVATGIVFFPVAPLFLLTSGKDIGITAGTAITAFVQGDIKLDMSKFSAPPIGPAATPANAMSSVSVESNVTGADIEVDGNFVGSTPSKVEVTPGSHAILVKKKGYQTWTRTMNVSGTGAKVNAELEQQVAGAK